MEFPMLFQVIGTACKAGSVDHCAIEGVGDVLPPGSVGPGGMLKLAIAAIGLRPRHWAMWPIASTIRVAHFATRAAGKDRD
jgi:hypothetical protein